MIGGTSGASSVGQLFKIPGEPQGNRIAEIVNSISQDGDAVGSKAAGNFQKGETEVEEEGKLQVLVTSVMRVLVFSGHRSMARRSDS